MSNVYLQSLELINLGPFGKYTAEFDKGPTLIIGENGTGKTTMLRALSLFFEGGADYDLIRHGQMSGEATITFNDGAKVWKKLKLADPAVPGDKPSYEMKAWGPEGEIKKSPASWLAERVPKSSFDPFKFLRSEPKTRAAFLLEHLPLVFDASEVNAAQDTPVGNLPNVDVLPMITGKVTLERLNEIRDARYEDRRVANVAQRDIEGVIAELNKTLPPDSNGLAWSEIRAGLQVKLTTVERDIAAMESTIKLESEQARSSKRLEIQGKIDALNAELANFLTEANTAEIAAILEGTQALQEQKAGLSVELGTAIANETRETEASGTRKAVESRQESARGMVRREMRLTAVMKALDDLKHKRLKEVEIDGFDLKKDARGNPVITIHGVPLDQLNAQQQLFIAVQCIQLGAGEMPILLAESSDLDDPHMGELIAVTKQAGIQLIAARWANECPTVKVEKVA